ncbi:MAG: phosphoenolpyruvate carboxykinase [Alphaproteobacteria bacterium]|nr:phosphoenolpyruvate carboxykinase [Alphaproteobacteria bacterium]
MSKTATKLAQPANQDTKTSTRKQDDLSTLGFTGLTAVHSNLLPAALYEHALRKGEAELTADGALRALTGSHTGRSPNDKFIVEDSHTKNTIDWGKVNRPISAETFDALHKRMLAWAEGRELYTQNLLAGADKTYRLQVRVVTQHAWQSLFARNMFIRPAETELAEHDPEFTVIDFPEFQADPARDGTNSGTFIIVNFARKLVLIGGTAYAGEIKKSIFSIMNYMLPERGVMPMHASANIGAEGDVAIFFGLSGTGKTTLSADGSRTLIGDDEHGWTDHTVFNFEGGCYAKAIRLNPVQEPEIYAASRRFGTVLENVVMDDDARKVDFDDATFAENSRSCYPIDFISNASETGIGGLPQNIIMLTCDAFGVLPPISKMTAEQAMYHFLSGYTARVAGTERGVTEPQATFSACFGAPFMPRAPGVYAKLLGEKIAYHKVNCWLVNTGWTGGGYGVGERMPINITRTLVRAIFNGAMEQAKFVDDGVFGLAIPASVPGVPADALNPRAAWSDKAAYDKSAAQVAKLFADNFKKFEAQVDEKVRAAAMKGV